MLNDLQSSGEKKMKEVISSVKKAFSGVRTGRANPSLLDRITVPYYGANTPLNQLSSVSAPEPRLLLIQPWDKSIIKDIEKAIQTSDLDLVPTNDGNVIRIAIPQLTEERRKQLVKLVKKEAEDHRVGIRNIRRELNEEIKKLEKDGEISEDDAHRSLNEIQELTDKYIAEIDKAVEAKEKEILEI